MEVIYGLIPGMIILGLGMVVVFIWAAKSGQFDDLEGAAHRILMDDDDPLLERKSAESKSGNLDCPDTHALASGEQADSQSPKS